MSQSLVDNFAMDYYMPSKDLGPLSHDWSLDNAIGLFSMNTIMPEDLNLSVSDEMIDLPLGNLPMNATDLGTYFLPSTMDDTLSHESGSSVCIFAPQAFFMIQLTILGPRERRPSLVTHIYFELKTIANCPASTGDLAADQTATRTSGNQNGNQSR